MIKQGLIAIAVASLALAGCQSMPGSGGHSSTKSDFGCIAGTVGGAIVGTMLGSTIGGGRGRTIASAAGLAGGGYLGNRMACGE